MVVDTWYHIVGVYTSGDQRLYIDGVEVASSTATDTITYYAQEVWIGRANYTYTDLCKIDEVRIYDTALTASEIKALYLYPAGSKGCKISALQINGPLVTYANNAAAIAGGLVVGDLYRNGADPDLVCIVH